MLTVVCHINHLHFPVVNGQYEGGWNANQNQMKNTSYFYTIFQVLNVAYFL